MLKFIFLTLLVFKIVVAFKGLVSVDRPMGNLPASQPVSLEVENFIGIDTCVTKYTTNPNSYEFQLIKMEYEDLDSMTPWYQLNFHVIPPQVNSTTRMFTADVVIAGIKRTNITFDPSNQVYERFLIDTRKTNGGKSAVGRLFFRGELLTEVTIENPQPRHVILRRPDYYYTASLSIVNGRFGMPGNIFHNVVDSELNFSQKQWVTSVNNIDGFSPTAKTRYYAIDTLTEEITPTFFELTGNGDFIAQGVPINYLEIKNPTKTQTTLSKFKIGGLNYGSVDKVWFITSTIDESRFQIIANNRMKIAGIPAVKECKLKTTHFSEVSYLYLRYDIIAYIDNNCTTSAEFAANVYFETSWKFHREYNYGSVPYNMFVARPGHIYFKFVSINLGTKAIRVSLQFLLPYKMPVNIRLLSHVIDSSFDGEKYTHNHTDTHLAVPVKLKYRRPRKSFTQVIDKYLKSSMSFVEMDDALAFCSHQKIRVRLTCGIINITSLATITLPKTWVGLVGYDLENMALIGKDANSQFQQWKNGKARRLPVAPNIDVQATFMRSKTKKTNHFAVNFDKIHRRNGGLLIRFDSLMD